MREFTRGRVNKNCNTAIICNRPRYPAWMIVCEMEISNVSGTMNSSNWDSIHLLSRCVNLYSKKFSFDYVLSLLEDFISIGILSFQMVVTRSQRRFSASRILCGCYRFQKSSMKWRDTAVFRYSRSKRHTTILLFLSSQKLPHVWKFCVLLFQWV